MNVRYVGVCHCETVGADQEGNMLSLNPEPCVHAGVPHTLGCFPKLDSTVRQVMVRIMCSSTVPARPDPGMYRASGGDNMHALASPSASGILSTGQAGRREARCVDSSIPMDASTCMFWCAVALGGLVQGQPTESVSP